MAQGDPSSCWKQDSIDAILYLGDWGWGVRDLSPNAVDSW